MKDKLTFALVLLLLLGVAFLVGRWTKTAEIREVEVVKTDTLTVYDTTFIEKPYPVTEKVVETIYVPVTDTLHLHDTTYVVLPRTQKEYSDSTYHAWVSGFLPSLDSIAVYQKTKYITTTIREKPKRFGVGVQAGYGFGKNGFSPYVGVGVSYNLISF